MGVYAWAGATGSSTNIMNSRIGRALKSLRDSELAAQSAGINVAAYKLRIFVLTAVLASLQEASFASIYVI